MGKVDYKNSKILIVDDIQEVLDSTERYLTTIGVEAVKEINPEKALEYLKTNKVDLILLDYFMPELTGEDFISKLREFDEKTIIILHTGYANEIPSDEMMDKLNIQGYIDKTKSIEDKVLSIKSALKTAHLLKEINNLTYKNQFMGNLIKRNTDNIAGGLQSINRFADYIIKESDNVSIKENINTIQQIVSHELHIISALCFDSGKAQTLESLVKDIGTLLLNEYSEINLKINLNTDRTISLYCSGNGSAFLVYILMEIVLYVASIEQDTLDKNINISNEITESALRIIIDHDFDCEYSSELINTLHSLVRDSDGLATLTIDEKKIIIELGDITNVSDTGITIGKPFWIH